MNHLSDELLNEYLDEALPDRAPLEAHLAQCADCTARLAALQAVFAQIGSLPEVDLVRDLAASVTRRLGNSSAAAFGVPRWLTLTVVLQAALGLIAVILAAPFVNRFASSAMPALPAPSLSDTIFQVHSQWVAWLDALSQLQLPTMPAVPAVELSSLYFLLALAGVSIFWLVGNGLLLRDQIK